MSACSPLPRQHPAGAVNKNPLGHLSRESVQLLWLLLQPPAMIDLSALLIPELAVAIGLVHSERAQMNRFQPDVSVSFLQGEASMSIEGLLHPTQRSPPCVTAL